MAPRPSALTLDLFGTLVDLDIVRDETPLVEHLLRGAEEAADPAKVLQTWMQASLEDRARTPFRRVRSTLELGAHQAATVHGLSIEPPRWADALEDLWASRPLHEDVADALDELDEAGVPWAIVTNLDAHVLEQVLAATGLADRDPVAVCSEHARAYKPHPRPFRMAVRRLGASLRETVHIGDRASEDRAGARAAGLARCRLIDRGEGEPLPVLIQQVLGAY